jgi:TRAP-type C4-dicarboxylate transport system permease small subunit
MEKYEKIITRMVAWGEAVAAAFLLGIMTLTVANVVFRFFGRAIAGTYELVEIGIVITASLALAYTSLTNGHVIVGIIVSFLSERMRTMLSVITTVISLFLWGVITWMSILLALKRGLQEETILLGITFLPFRLIWIYGLMVFIGVLLLDFCFARKGKVRGK